MSVLLLLLLWVLIIVALYQSLGWVAKRLLLFPAPQVKGSDDPTHSFEHHVSMKGATFRERKSCVALSLAVVYGAVLLYAMLLAMLPWTQSLSDFLWLVVSVMLLLSLWLLWLVAQALLCRMEPPESGA